MRQRILTILGYLAGSAVIVLATVSLVAYGQGYTYDFKSGRIIRTGLVIIQSTPGGAQVSLNGKKLNKKTTYRQSFEQGRYEFALAKDGFHPWKKTFEIVASEVALVQYALLVPLSPAIKTLDSRPAVTTQVMSKDHRHLAYVSEGSVYTLDVEGGKPVKAYAPRAATPELPAEVVSEVWWSDDASRLLIVAKVGESPVHYLMSPDGGSVTNLTEQYRFNFSGLRFAGNNARQLYWISPDGLRKLDTEAQSVSAVLADKVRQFQVAGDRVLYVQRTDLGESLWSIDRNGHKQELVAALPESESYALAISAYRGQEQLAVVPSRTKVGTLYSDIYGTRPVAKTVAHDVTQTAFSPDGHLLTFYSDSRLLTYDLERSDLTHQPVVYEFGGISGLSNLTWFDNFHLLLSQHGELVLTEFDGANTLDMGALAGNWPAYSTSDLRSIVAFRPGGTPASPAVAIDEVVIRP